MANEEMQKKTHKNWKQLSWMSQSPSSSFNVWLLFINIKLFDSESDFLNVARAPRWQTSGSKGFVGFLFVCLFVFCRSRINVMCMCHNSSQFCGYCFCMQVSQGASWYSGLVLLVWASILMAAAAERKRIKSENHLTFCPFLIGVPEDDVNI